MYIITVCTRLSGRKRGRLMGWWAVGFFGRTGPLVEGYALFEQLGIRDDFVSCLLFSTFSIVNNN